MLIPVISKKAGSLSRWSVISALCDPGVLQASTRRKAQQRRDHSQSVFMSPRRASLKIYSKLDVLRMRFPPPCFCNSSSWQNVSLKRQIVNIFRLCPLYILCGTYTSASYQGTTAGYTHINAVGASQYSFVYKPGLRLSCP